MIQSNVPVESPQETDLPTPGPDSAGLVAHCRSRLLSLLVGVGLAGFLLTIGTVWIENSLRSNGSWRASVWWTVLLAMTAGIVGITYVALRKQEAVYGRALAAVLEQNRVDAALRDGEDLSRQLTDNLANEAQRALEGRMDERASALEQAYSELQRQLADHNRAEAELREARHMLNLVMNHIPQAVFWKDRQSVYLGANERLARDAGVDSPEDFLGKTDFDFPWVSGAEGFRADDAEVMETGCPKLNVEKSYYTPEGLQTWLRTNKVPLRDLKGTVIGVLATYEDITEEKEIQAELVRSKQLADDANRAKSDFLSRMSHELRTPLNAILGFGQILEMRTEAGTMEGEAVSHILKGGRHLLDLVNEVLDLASIEAGRISLSPEPVSVGQVVSDVLKLLQPLASARSIGLTKDGVEQDERYLQADLQRFKQVLLNLVSNAIKYNCDGGKVMVSCESNGEFLRILVRDTGAGLEAEELGRLFVPFERLKAARTPVEGAGIGLALSKRLTEAMGGRIGVSSVPGHGSSFWVEFPAAEDPNQQVGEAQVLPVREQEIHSNKVTGPERTVLYIEDNLSNFKLVQLLFDSIPGVRLLSAMQGTLGLDLARQQRPDLILLDLHLPDISGEVVLRRLRAESPTRNIPVVVLSADAMPAQIANLRAAGIVDYLTKPIDIKQLLRVVESVLNSSKID